MTRRPNQAPAGAGLRCAPGPPRSKRGLGGPAPALAAGKSGTIDGAWGSSAALAAAALAADTPARSSSWCRTRPTLMPWVEDIGSFTGTRRAVFEAWEAGRSIPTRGSSTRPPPRGCGSSSNLQPIRRRWWLPLSRRCVSRCRRAPTSPPRPDARTAGEVVDPAELAEWLVANGLQARGRGRVSRRVRRRGGICDIFPPDAADPVRLEFFGDELESIRTFAVSSQRSLEKTTGGDDC